MQPPQDAGALLLRRPTKRGKGAPGRDDGAPRILFVGQSDVRDDPAIGRTDDLHDFLTMGFHERTIDVMGGDALDRAFFCDGVHGVLLMKVTTLRTM